MRAVLLLVALSFAACQSPGSDAAADMRDQHDGDTPTPTAATEGTDSLAVVSERVQYATVDGEPVMGLLVRPENAEAGLPGVVVIQEWWGLNDNIEAMARRLAAEGYVALAVDLYNGEAATTPEGAMALMDEAMGREADLTDNLAQAVGYLADDLAAPRIGVIGWCFGGMWSLRTALAAPDRIDATVIYYGRPVTDPARLERLTMPVLAHFGGADMSIPADTVAAFDAALTEAGVEHLVRTYPDAPHAFANASGKAYVPAAADEAWSLTTTFLADYLLPPTEADRDAAE